MENLLIQAIMRGDDEMADEYRRMLGRPLAGDPDSDLSDEEETIDDAPQSDSEYDSSPSRSHQLNPAYIKLFRGAPPQSPQSPENRAPTITGDTMTTNDWTQNTREYRRQPVRQPSPPRSPSPPARVNPYAQYLVGPPPRAQDVFRFGRRRGLGHYMDMANGQAPPPRAKIDIMMDEPESDPEEEEESESESEPEPEYTPVIEIKPEIKLEPEHIAENKENITQNNSKEITEDIAEHVTVHIPKHTRRLSSQYIAEQLPPPLPSRRTTRHITERITDHTTEHTTKHTTESPSSHFSNRIPEIKLESEQPSEHITEPTSELLTVPEPELDMDSDLSFMIADDNNTAVLYNPPQPTSDPITTIGAPIEDRFRILTASIQDTKESIERLERLVIRLATTPPQPPVQIQQTQIHITFGLPRNPFPKWLWTLMQILFLLFLAWFCVESTICAAYCRPEYSYGGRTTWKYNDPLWGFALPYKIDDWTGVVISRAWRDYWNY